MLRTGRVLGIVSFCLVSTFCVPAKAQENDRQRAARDTSSTFRAPELSDLAKENLERVAASATQLQAVFLKDAGMLVELKRWVAKEATDNGQIVEDASLTDQAIFERLEHDVAFRSVATRLVQRYGYLLPTINPDSDFAKQQDLVLKERARRLVQIEAQEDTESLRPGGTESNQGQKVERTACDPDREGNCSQPSSRRGRQGISQPDETPGVDQNAPTTPEQPRPSASGRTLRAGVGRDQSGTQDYSTTTANLTLASDPSRRPQDSLTRSMPADGLDGLGTQLGSSSLD